MLGAESPFRLFSIREIVTTGMAGYIASHLCARDLFSKNYYHYTQHRSDSTCSVRFSVATFLHSWGVCGEHHTP